MSQGREGAPMWSWGSEGPLLKRVPDRSTAVVSLGQADERAGVARLSWRVSGR